MLTYFDAVKKLDGFDNSVSPHWLMIGAETEKSVILNNGNNFSVKIRNPAIAEIVNDVIESVTLQQRIITIKGKNKGTTFLDVFDGNALKTRLEVCVKNRREISVSFHYVVDKDGVGSRRVAAELKGIIDYINDKIFLPQANVSVRIGVINAPLKVDRVLGKYIRDTSEFPDISKTEHEVDYIMSFRDRAANINVFFVIDYESGRNPRKNKTAGVQYEKGIFIDDNINTVSSLATIENVLAHEIAHYLGVGGESHYYHLKNIDRLMYSKARGGLRILKVHANMMNR